MTKDEIRNWKAFADRTRRGLQPYMEETVQDGMGFVTKNIKSNTARVTGKLRAGWTGGDGTVGPYQYAKTLKVYKGNNYYRITNTNDVEYASWVEFGHNQEVGRYVAKIHARLVRPHVPGFYYMTEAVNDSEEELVKRMGKNALKYSRRVINGK